MQSNRLKTITAAAALIAMIASAAILLTVVRGGEPGAFESKGREVLAGGGGSALSADGPGCEKTWYFAEGSARPGFREYLCIFNPCSYDASATVTHMLDGGEKIQTVHGLPAGSRTTVDVNSEVPPGSDFSTTVESSQPVAAERAIYFEYKGAVDGGHQVRGASAPASRWYFAEGCTRPGFDTYLTISNPNPEDALVDIYYHRGDGTDLERPGIPVGAMSRFTVAVHDDNLGIGRHDGPAGDVSIEVESDESTPLVVERPMYFSDGAYFNGGHDSFGAVSAENTLLFAEGCTRPGFETYLCLLNPGEDETEVDITYHRGDGETVVREGVEIEPEARFTVAVHREEMGIGAHDGPAGDVSIEVESSYGAGIVAERSIYYTYRPFWTGGTDAVGCSAPGEEWFLAEGCTRHGYETYLCMGNFEEDDAVVDLEYCCGDGTSNTVEVAVPGNARVTVPVHGTSPGLGRHDDNRGDVSTRVTSRNGAPVVVERSMYASQKWRTIDRQALAAAWGWGEVYAGNPNENQVALTFDIEYDASAASAIVDVLRSKNVCCTIFLVGSFPQSHPDLVASMAADGHELANHSMTHPMCTRLSAGQLAWELASTDSAVSAATGFATKPYFRFPYDDRNASAISVVNSQGYIPIRWSVDPQDWSGPSVQAMQSNVISSSHNGSIILMHDKRVTVAALPGIIDGLRAKGLNPVTVSEVLYPGP